MYDPRNLQNFIEQFNDAYELFTTGSLPKKRGENEMSHRDQMEQQNRRGQYQDAERQKKEFTKPIRPWRTHNETGIITDIRYSN
jgi:hypothetical protein